MQRKRSRFALLGILALAFSVTAGLTLGGAAEAKKKGGGGGGTKTITKAGAAIPDSVFTPTPPGTGNGGESSNGVLVSRIVVGRKFAGAKIKDLNVEVTLTHSDIGDLEIYLIGPNGANVGLLAFTDNNAPGTVFAPTFSLGRLGPTVFDDQAALFIDDFNSCPALDPDPPGGGTCAGPPAKPDGGGLEARAPYAGSFKPEFRTLASLGSKLQGTWSLVILDNDAFVGAGDNIDIGSLTNWKLIAQLKGGSGGKK